MITKTEFGQKLMKVIGAQAGVTYLSAPITTGYRDLVLMRELAVSKEQLRRQFPTEFRTRVTEPNEREAQKYAQMVRRIAGRGLVINPGELYVPDWTQRDYMTFWEETIRSFCMEVVLAPGWEFSAGARYEAAVSLQTMLKILDVHGREVTPVQMQMIDARARARLLAEGFEQDLIDTYMPFIDFVATSANPADFTQSVKGFADIIVRCNQDIRQRQQDPHPEDAGNDQIT